MISDILKCARRLLRFFELPDGKSLIVHWIKRIAYKHDHNMGPAGILVVVRWVSLSTSQYGTPIANFSEVSWGYFIRKLAALRLLAFWSQKQVKQVVVVAFEQLHTVKKKNVCIKCMYDVWKYYNKLLTIWTIEFESLPTLLSLQSVILEYNWKYIQVSRRWCMFFRFPNIRMQSNSNFGHFPSNQSWVRQTLWK